MENLLSFKPPIFYNHAKKPLSIDIVRDLELVQTVDPSNQPLYAYSFNFDNNNSENMLSTKAVQQLSKYYTTDIPFIKDNQTLLKKLKLNHTQINEYKKYSNNYQTIIQTWREIKEDSGFKEKYNYVDWSSFEFLNKNEYFLQLMSVYSMTSPIITLLVPIFILIIPFLIIKCLFGFRNHLITKFLRKKSSPFFFTFTKKKKKKLFFI